MAFDGVPAPGLVQAAALEALVGLACQAILIIRGIPTGKTAWGHQGDSLLIFELSKLSP